MEAPLQVVAIATLATGLFFLWLHRVVAEPQLSGDSWYMRRFAFTDCAVSSPYCWRPLLPMLARWFGFGPVSFTASLLTPLAIYGYLGGGWAACALALTFVGNRVIFSFNIRNPDYAEGLGQLLFILGLWSVQSGHLSAWAILFLAVLCREAIGAALAVVALFYNPFLVLAVAAGGGLAYFTRREDLDNRHPLIEKTAYDTLVRWVRVKGDGALHYCATVQPTRLIVLAVPFAWGAVADPVRWSLLAAIPFWFFALPASGQSRHMAYTFGLLAPFVAALPGPWPWFFCLGTWFWPIDYATYDETGGVAFGFAK